MPDSGLKSTKVIEVVLGKPLQLILGRLESRMSSYENSLPTWGGQESRPGREMVAKLAKRGRPQSIPPEHWETVFRLYSEGKGYRAIADLLIPMHVSTTKSSVEPLIKGLPPYQGRRVISPPLQ